MNTRVKKLRNVIKDLDLDALVVMTPQNRLYLTKFTGSSGWAVITKDKQILITDFRYTEQAAQQAKGFDIVKHEGPIISELKQLISKLGVRKIGFEEAFVTYHSYNLLKEALPSIELVPCSGVVEGLRIIKDDSEIQALKEAQAIADQAYTHIKTFIKSGMTERDVAVELAFTMRKLGASGEGFPTIVASGVNASRPHHTATDKIIEYGDGVKMDYGCIYKGYHSDITRTVFVGKVTDKQRDVYNKVLEAQLAALDIIKAGVTGKEVDAAARNIIYDAGYTENFGHSLGHGIGLQGHEAPRFSPSYTGIIESGMALSVEPGIYIPKWGGVRIEDLIIVTEDGCVNITSSPKELTVLQV